MGLSDHLDCFDPAAALSTRFFTLGFAAFVLGVTFFGLPLDSFMALGLSCAGAPYQVEP